MSRVTISQHVLNKITTYLGQRPYIEVFPIFEAIKEHIESEKRVDLDVKEGQKKETSEKKE